MTNILGTPSRIGGVTLEVIAQEAFERHHNSYGVSTDTLILRDTGNFHWRAGGEKHINEPASIAALQVHIFIKIVFKFYLICFFLIGICDQKKSNSLRKIQRICNGSR